MQLQVTKKSNNTEKITTTEYSCRFCNRVFMRESTINTHICEQKRRWLEKDRPPNRIAFQTFARFYRFNTNSKAKTIEDFIKSSYYIAFVKYGTYCADVGVINIDRYTDWLLQNKIGINDWISDEVYKRYLIEYLRNENSLDAIHRSISTLVDLSQTSSGSAADFLRWGNRNRICHKITTGHISPWLLYQCGAGREFLDGLNSDELRVVFDYINPELWSLQFKRKDDEVREVKELLSRGGF